MSTWFVVDSIQRIFYNLIDVYNSCHSEPAAISPKAYLNSEALGHTSPRAVVHGTVQSRPTWWLRFTRVLRQGDVGHHPNKHDQRILCCPPQSNEDR